MSSLLNMVYSVTCW